MEESEEEKKEYLLNGEQGDYCGDLLEKYEEFIFENENDENEFIEKLKSTLDDKDLDFETKIYIIRGLTMDVILHREVDKEFYLSYYLKKHQ